MAAFMVGTLVGLFARPFVDAYLEWKTSQLYAAGDGEIDALFDESIFKKPQ
jgi:hypothetical protein